MSISAHIQNYQSTFYASGEATTPSERETDSLAPYSLNGPINSHSAPILPRTVPTSSSFHQSPWIQPGRSWMNDNGAAAVTSPSTHYGKPAHWYWMAWIAILSGCIVTSPCYAWNFLSLPYNCYLLSALFCALFIQCSMIMLCWS